MTLTWKYLQRRTLLKFKNTKKSEKHFFDGTQNIHEYYKINKCKKLSSTSTIKHKTDMNITKLTNTKK